MTNASSLQNLVKNVGCAVGTSSVGVLISRFSQVHQHYLVDKLTPLNPAFQERVATMTAAFSQYSSLDIATYKANYLMYANMLKQSVFCAYMDTYKIYGITLLMLIPMIFLLKNIVIDDKTNN